MRTPSCVVLISCLFVVACASGSADTFDAPPSIIDAMLPPPDGPATPDAPPTLDAAPTPDAVPTPDAPAPPDAAPPPDAPQVPDAAVFPDAAVPDAFVSPSTESLGQLCGALGDPACPTGYTCITLMGGSTTQGWCTVPCAGTTDTTTCSNGYAGPGSATCNINGAMAGEFFCDILCLDHLDSSCPTGMTCLLDGDGDLTNGNEFCSP